MCAHITYGLVAVLLGVFVLTTTDAQTKSQSKQKKTTQLKAAEKARADSIAAVVRADSILRVEQAKALDDSIKRADSLAAIKRIELRKLTNEAFGVGEQLVFSVNYGFITAGEAMMAIPGYDSVAGRNCYRIEFTVTSLPSFSWIYKVEDRYLTFIDVEAIVPWKFEQHIREGTYKRDFIAEFDQINHVARTTEGDYPIPEYVHDIMSAFYYARTLDFSGMKAGDGITMHNFYKDTSHELRVKFLGRQELNIEAGTFRTIVVEPLVKEGGLFKSEGRIVIWLSDDERKIPVRVNTKVLIGSIDVELKSYSGIVGPLPARIK
ncbi:MAG: DUF3108 domain-containing protein [Ignavibacteriae bacterium]|nr:DUF3108 domain-containing protein [Ignavibacteriota bacterium]